MAVCLRSRAAYFTFRGHLDSSAPSPTSVVDAALKHPSKLAILDLTAASAVDSEGAAWLEQVSALADSRGVRVRVVANKGSRVRRTMELLRFDRFMVLAASIREALRFGRTKPPQLVGK